MQSTTEIATLAGGCFWGVEEILRKLPGVVETTAGYTGGETPDPTYPEVKHGDTGHAEAVQIVFDPKKMSYETLLDYFFKLHDPTTPNRQGNDMGTQYRSAIFYHNDTQKEMAFKVKEGLEMSGKWKRKIVTEIVAAKPFHPAEEYHQKYLLKNPGGYTCHYTQRGQNVHIFDSAFLCETRKSKKKRGGGLPGRRALFLRLTKS